jgi:uncharacterized protein
MWIEKNMLLKRTRWWLEQMAALILLGSIQCVWAGEIGEHRVALIIGNNDYTYFPTLGNAVRDARAIKNALLDSGWKEENIVYRENLTARDIGSTLQAFRGKMQKDGAALIFYAGHGVQDNNSENYLLAADAHIEALSDLPLASISVSHILKQLEESKNSISIVILDACRTPIDPASLGVKASGRAGGSQFPRGLARVDVAPNATNPVYVVYSTQPNQIANDGPRGGNSDFTSALVHHLPTPGVLAEVMFKNVFQDVFNKNSGQKPDASGWIMHTFYFNLKSKPSHEAALNATGAYLGAQKSHLVNEDAYEQAADGVNLVKLALKERTIQQIENSANQGDAEASYLFGVAKWVGVGTNQDPITARKYLQKAANVNFRRAVFAYGNLLWLGEGGPVDRNQAVQLWEASATQRFIPSMIRLARYLAFDASENLKNPARARTLLQKAAPEDPEALTFLADMAYEGVGQKADVQAGIGQYEAAANAGSPTANIRLANLYRWGFNVKKNPVRSMDYYKAAAELGSAEGMLSLGKMYLNGDEVPTDIKLAISWLQKASSNHHRDADSWLVKAYIENSAFKPDDWSLDARAISGAREGFMDGLVKLVTAYRNGSTLTPKDLAKADQLAALGLEAIAGQPAGSEAAWPMFAYSLAKARLEAANVKAANTMSDKTQAQLERRWGKNTSLKRFTIPIQCAGNRQTYNIFLWDSTGPENPATEQIEWLKASRGCTVNGDVTSAFEKLYQIALENNVSFTDLAVYALASQDSASDKKPATRPAEEASSNGNSSVTPHFAASGLKQTIDDIARFESVKNLAKASVRPDLPPETLANQLEAALSTDALQAARRSSACTNVRALTETRSKKAGESADIIRLDLNCAGVASAILMLPDEAGREAILYVASKPASSSAGPVYSTRYYISRTGTRPGVAKSLHDVDGDGKPDTFGVHIGGAAEPTKALPLTTRPM